jgi:PleD family two-component response regulator
MYLRLPKTSGNCTFGRPLQADSDVPFSSTKESAMTKIAPKSAKTAPAAKGKVLNCESDSSILAAQSQLFERNGYTVENMLGRAAAEQALLKGTYDIVVLGHTLTKDDRHHLAYKAKRSSSDTQVLVLHASGKHPAVDIAIDDRQGEKAVIAALESLMQQRLLVAC